jgi:hypothetical protein
VDAFSSLPPFDIGRYFQPIKESYHTGIFNGLVVTADPMRVALIFSWGAPGSTGATYLSTNAQQAAGQGLALVATWPTVTLTVAEFGPMVQQAWYAIVPGGNLYVAEIIISRWPEPTPSRRRGNNANSSI